MVQFTPAVAVAAIFGTTVLASPTYGTSLKVRQAKCAIICPAPTAFVARKTKIPKNTYCNALGSMVGYLTTTPNPCLTSSALDCANVCASIGSSCVGTLWSSNDQTCITLAKAGKFTVQPSSSTHYYQATCFDPAEETGCSFPN